LILGQAKMVGSTQLLLTLIQFSDEKIVIQTKNIYKYCWCIKTTAEYGPDSY